MAMPESLQGRRVKIHSLVSRSDLNGCEGEIIAYMKERRRFGVKINDLQPILLKSSNLLYGSSELDDAPDRTVDLEEQERLHNPRSRRPYNPANDLALAAILGQVNRVRHFLDAPVVYQVPAQTDEKRESGEDKSRMSLRTEAAHGQRLT